jgi:hypothetical protein
MKLLYSWLVRREVLAIAAANRLCGEKPPAQRCCMKHAPFSGLLLLLLFSDLFRVHIRAAATTVP